MIREEQAFLVERLLNTGGAAEGTAIPPRLIGSYRVPPVSGLTVDVVAVYPTTVEYRLAWLEPETAVENISHYEIWFGLSDRTISPQGPFIAYRSPAYVTVPRTYYRTPFFIFHVITVLQNGLRLPAESAPTATALSYSLYPPAENNPGENLPDPDPNQPVILYFTASPGEVNQPGASTILSWSVSNATAVTLNSQNVGLTGTQAVVHPSTDTTYTLTAVNGTKTAQATVTLSPAAFSASQVVYHIIRYRSTAPSW